MNKNNIDINHQYFNKDWHDKSTHSFTQNINNVIITEVINNSCKSSVEYPYFNRYKRTH